MTYDLPPKIQERVICSIAAAAKYQIPANIMLAVQETEGGKAHQWVRNTNGTYDVGQLQFNTSYLKILEKRYGITANDVAAPGCYAFDLAAWRISQHIRNDKGDIWTRAANYHSKTPKYNLIYRSKLIKRASKWADWLDKHFPANGSDTPIDVRMRYVATNQPVSTNSSESIRHTENRSYTPRKLLGY